MKESSKEMTIGLDLGDRRSHYVVLGREGEVVEQASLATRAAAFCEVFSSKAPATVALEVGTHSPWVSRLLQSLGLEVIVANPRKVRLIYGGRRKSDRLDAEKLARLARADRALLYPMRHRGEAAQADLARLRSRDVLVRARTSLVVQVRTTVKSFGGRISPCSTPCFAERASEQIPAALLPALTPLLSSIQTLTDQIRSIDRELERLAQESYPETQRLTQVSGVGTLTALAFVLIVEDPKRFTKSREVGPYLGLVPGRSQSGSRDPGLRITREGDRLLRRLLVQSAHYVLGHFGPETDLRHFGQRVELSGHQTSKRKARVAVARKLAVLLHRLWVSGDPYEPLRQQQAA